MGTNNCTTIKRTNHDNFNYNETENNENYPENNNLNKNNEELQSVIDCIDSFKNKKHFPSRIPLNKNQVESLIYLSEKRYIPKKQFSQIDSMFEFNENLIFKFLTSKYGLDSYKNSYMTSSLFCPLRFLYSIRHEYNNEFEIKIIRGMAFLLEKNYNNTVFSKEELKIQLLSKVLNKIKSESPYDIFEPFKAFLEQSSNKTAFSGNNNRITQETRTSKNTLKIENNKNSKQNEFEKDIFDNSLSIIDSNNSNKSNKLLANKFNKKLEIKNSLAIENRLRTASSVIKNKKDSSKLMNTSFHSNKKSHSNKTKLSSSPQKNSFNNTIKSVSNNQKLPLKGIMLNNSKGKKDNFNFNVKTVNVSTINNNSKTKDFVDKGFKISKYNNYNSKLFSITNKNTKTLIHNDYNKVHYKKMSLYNYSEKEIKNYKDKAKSLIKTHLHNRNNKSRIKYKHDKNPSYNTKSNKLLVIREDLEKDGNIKLSKIEKGEINKFSSLSPKNKNNFNCNRNRNEHKVSNTSKKNFKELKLSPIKGQFKILHRKTLDNKYNNKIINHDDSSDNNSPVITEFNLISDNKEFRDRAIHNNTLRSNTFKNKFNQVISNKYNSNKYNNSFGNTNINKLNYNNTITIDMKNLNNINNTNDNNYNINNINNIRNTDNLVNTKNSGMKHSKTGLSAYPFNNSNTNNKNVYNKQLSSNFLVNPLTNNMNSNSNANDINIINSLLSDNKENQITRSTKGINKKTNNLNKMTKNQKNTSSAASINDLLNNNSNNKGNSQIISSNNGKGNERSIRPNKNKVSLKNFMNIMNSNSNINVLNKDKRDKINITSLNEINVKPYNKSNHYLKINEILGQSLMLLDKFRTDNNFLFNSPHE